MTALTGFDLMVTTSVSHGITLCRFTNGYKQEECKRHCSVHFKSCISHPKRRNRLLVDKQMHYLFTSVNLKKLERINKESSQILICTKFKKVFFEELSV